MRKDTKEKKALEMLLKVSKKVSSSLELEEVSDTILWQVKSVLHTDYSALFLVDEASKKLMLIGAKGFNSDQIENLKVLGSLEKINTELVKNKRSVSVNDITKSPIFRHKRVPFAKEKLHLGAFLAVPLKADSRIIGVLVVSNHAKKRSHFTDEDKKLLHTLANHVSISLLNAKLYKNIKDLFVNTITSLVTAVDAKDPYTHGHSERVSRYAVAIAEEMKCSARALEDLKLSGLMHDVGKIGISDAILSKTSKLNKLERKSMQRHPLIGSRIVKSVMVSKNALKGIEEHHEYFNGKGYPEGLKGKKISLAGRIIAVADTFDTITTNRPYQRAFSSKEAALEIIRSSGTQFDPKVVKAFQKSFSKRPDVWKFR